MLSVADLGAKIGRRHVCLQTLRSGAFQRSWSCPVRLRIWL